MWLPDSVPDAIAAKERIERKELFVAFVPIVAKFLRQKNEGTEKCVRGQKTAAKIFFCPAFFHRPPREFSADAEVLA
jgi:hypothetical protein